MANYFHVDKSILLWYCISYWPDWTDDVILHIVFMKFMTLSKLIFKINKQGYGFLENRIFPWTKKVH